jgi:hypothetical protein
VRDFIEFGHAINAIGKDNAQYPFKPLLVVEVSPNDRHDHCSVKRAASLGSLGL